MKKIWITICSFIFAAALCGCGLLGDDSSSNGGESSGQSSPSSSTEISSTLEESSDEQSSVEDSSEEISSDEQSSVEDSSEISVDDESSVEDSSEISVDDESSFVEESSEDDSTGVPCDKHEDDDNNGICDNCGMGVIQDINFFSINDLHGKFVDNDSQPGVDELTSYLKTQTTYGNTILLSAGDMWQGGPESNATKGLIVTDWMNELGFSAMTLGNHEYDWGEEYIQKNGELANFPLLAINVYSSTTNQRVSYAQPSVMVNLAADIQVGIIGAIGDCYSSISPDKVEGVYFKTGAALTALVQEEATRLRQQGADFIVYSLHDGYGSNTSGNISNSQLSSYYQSVLSNGYVDLVFEGHSHKRYVLVDSYGVYHLQGGGDNAGISHAEVYLNTANGKFTVNVAETVYSSTYKAYPSDPLVDELLEKYQDDVAKMNEVVGINNSYRSSSSLCQLIADLYYQKGMETWGDEFDIVLGGGFLKARSPYNLYAGEITYGDLQTIFPFDNQIVLCAISGMKLSSQFFNSSSYYISYGEYGEEVKNSIQANKTYYIVVDTYTALYGPNGTTEIARLDETTFARDLLADYARDGGFGAKPPVDNGEEGSGDSSSGSLEDIEYDLTSIPEVLEIAQGLADNAQTSEKYYVMGKIVSITSAEKYGNMTIEDENGNQLYIYGTMDTLGNKYGYMANPPKVGDTVILYGVMKNYVYNSQHTYEMMNGIIVYAQ